MFPEVNGYDDIIRSKMTKYYPDTDGMLWFFDGHNEIKATLSILGSKYYNRFGYIYHPSYISLASDVEATEVAFSLNKLTKIEDVIMRHRHPAWGYESVVDSAHKMADIVEFIDDINLEKRRKNGFPK